jgi:hypothetical protein
MVTVDRRQRFQEEWERRARQGRPVNPMKPGLPVQAYRTRRRPRTWLWYLKVLLLALLTAAVIGLWTVVLLTWIWLQTGTFLGL